MEVRGIVGFMTVGLPTCLPFLSYMVMVMLVEIEAPGMVTDQLPFASAIDVALVPFARVISKVEPGIAP